jgi:23S rRNA pseudouridine2457 synthase
MAFHSFLFYKPYGVLSQFTPEGKWDSLASFGPFPEDVYAVGRLDADSEGLLLLTNDNRLKHRLTDPKFNHPRTYIVQVERVPSDDALGQLRSGVTFEGKRTKPAKVILLVEEPNFPPRSVPIRFRKNVPTAWMEMVITEGRNRQVRKMTAAVGHPALRLVRTKISNWTLDGLQPGSWREIQPEFSTGSSR